MSMRRSRPSGTSIGDLVDRLAERIASSDWSWSRTLQLGFLLVVFTTPFCIALVVAPTLALYAGGGGGLALGGYVLARGRRP